MQVNEFQHPLFDKKTLSGGCPFDYNSFKSKDDRYLKLNQQAVTLADIQRDTKIESIKANDYKCTYNKDLQDNTK